MSDRKRDKPDDHAVRALFEQGNGGPRRFSRFPKLTGNSERLEIWRAVNGTTQEDYEKALIASSSIDPHSIVMGFKKKIRARHKMEKFRRFDELLYEVSEVTPEDPYLSPRHMKKKDFVNLYSGVAFANKCGYKFNMHLTINWQKLGLTNHEAAESSLYKKFIKPYTEWCTFHGLICVWIYSNEVGAANGLHTHFLTAHIPKDIPIVKGYIEARMAKLNKSPNPPSDAYMLVAREKCTMATQWRWFSYLCKGVDPYALLRHMNGRDKLLASDLVQFAYENPGNVSCKKRCGISATIGKKKREEASFKSLMEQGILNVELLYSDSLFKPLPLTDEELREILKSLRID